MPSNSCKEQPNACLYFHRRLSTTWEGQRVPTYICRLRYARDGPDARTNGTLTPEDKAALHGKSFQEVLAEIKATGGAVFSRGASSYRGVTCGKNKWIARIRVDCKIAYLGYFASEEAAARAYDAAARLVHGRWALSHLTAPCVIAWPAGCLCAANHHHTYRCSTRAGYKHTWS